MRLLAERFRGTQAQCSFYCNRRSERLGRLHGWSPADPYPEFGPSGCLRRSVRKCPLSGPRLQPFAHGDLYGDFTSRSGLYRNEQKMRDVMPDVELLPQTFSKAGYWSGGSGKMLHYFIDAPSWDEYFPAKETENPFPKTLGPPKRPVSLPRGGPWQYYETDWGAIDATDEEYGGDYSVAEWVGARLSEKREKPFFLACGIYRPHEPWFVPKQYFDAFPLEKIQLPPGYRVDDLDDLPSSGVKSARNRYFDHIRAHKQWKQGIQGYLASIYFADAMLGRVLDALEKGPIRKTRLWSFGRIMAGISEKRNTGKSSPPGGSARGFPSLCAFRKE